MPKYGVVLPVTGQVYCEVEAASEEEAIELAMDFPFTNKDIEDWETHKQTNRGNIAYGNCTEASAEEID